MSATLSASVVGGGSGGCLSLDALLASPRYELVAAADISPQAREALAARYPGIQLYPSHEAMFADCPTDVVCVSTWPPTHLPVTLDALSLPGLRGLLVEKPLADTARSGHQLLQAIKERRLPMVVPHGLLKARHGEEIIARVHSGEIGELDLVEIQCNRWDIINAGIHWLDFFVNLLPDDPPAWVMAAIEASTQTYRDGMQVETTAVTYIQTESGVRCVMHTGDDVQIRRPGKDFLLRLVGSSGQIEFWAWESAYLLRNQRHPAGVLVEPVPHAKGGHQRYLEQLADQIEAGQTDYRYGELSLRALELCEGAYLAAANRCKITFPLNVDDLPAAPDWHPGQPYDGQGGRDGRKL